MDPGSNPDPLLEQTGQSAGLQPETHDRLRPIVTAFFRKRTSDPHEVDDLVQDVFLRLVRRGAFDKDDNVSAYAFRTAQSVWLDRGRYRRSRESDRHVSFDPDLHAGAEGGTEEAILARDSLRHAADAIAQLPDKTRHVFLLRRIDGLSMQQIADQLGISLSSAEKHVRKAALHLVKTRRRSQ